MQNFHVIYYLTFTTYLSNIHAFSMNDIYNYTAFDFIVLIEWYFINHSKYVLQYYVRTCTYLIGEI